MCVARRVQKAVLRCGGSELDEERFEEAGVLILKALMHKLEQMLRGSSSSVGEHTVSALLTSIPSMLAGIGREDSRQVSSAVR